MLPPTKLSPSSSEVIASAPSHMNDSVLNEDFPSGTPIQLLRPFSSDLLSESPGASGFHRALDPPEPIPGSSNLRPSFPRPMFFSFQTKPARAPMSRSASEWSLRRGESSLLRSQEGHNVGSSSKPQRSAPTIDTTEVRYAGEASVYYDEEVGVVLRIVSCICAMP